MGNCVEKPNRLGTTVRTRSFFVEWFRQDLEFTNDRGSAIGLDAGAAILKFILKILIRKQ